MALRGGKATRPGEHQVAQAIAANANEQQVRLREAGKGENGWLFTSIHAV
jgi:hypothetical protein